MYHLVVHVPLGSASIVREAMAHAGAGKAGNYDSCSFSCTGTGRFRPLKGATPAIGSVGLLESVEEERIEALVNDADLQEVLRAIVDVHPYEEPSIYVLPVQDYKEHLHHFS